MLPAIIIMISSTKNFLFIHVPKTGGNSIQNVLYKYADDRIVTPHAHHDGIERFELKHKEYPTSKHSKLSDYQRSIPSSIYGRLFKFSIIRNPWDRAISHFFSPHRGNVEWNRSEFLNFLPEVLPLRSYITSKKRGFARVRHFFQASFSTTKLDAEIDFLLRFEHLNEDFQAACHALNIPKQELVQRNASRREHYSKYYDTELIEIIRSKFSDEIDFGNYTFQHAQS